MIRYFFNGIRVYQEGGKVYGNVNVRYRDPLQYTDFKRSLPEDPYTTDINMFEFYYDTPDGYNYYVRNMNNRGQYGIKVMGGNNIPEEIRNFEWYQTTPFDEEYYSTNPRFNSYADEYDFLYGNKSKNKDKITYEDFVKQKKLKRNELFKKYFPNINIEQYDK